MLSVSSSWLSTHDFYPFLYESNKHIYNEADSWTESISKHSPKWLPTTQSPLGSWQIGIFRLSSLETQLLPAMDTTFHSSHSLPGSDFFGISSQTPRDVYQVAWVVFLQPFSIGPKQGEHTFSFVWERVVGRKYLYTLNCFPSKFLSSLTSPQEMAL